MLSVFTANMSGVCAIWLLVFLAFSTEAVPPRTPDDLQENLGDIRKTLGAVTSQLDKFNSFYLNKLETRMVVAASVLSSVESKVNNILERAHAWDTFQLHVRSWNEQMHTINNKMDILSRGQEEKAQLQDRLSVLQGLDYKLDRLGLRLEDMDRRLIALAKEKDSQKETPIVQEFAARGLLTTLKAVERKVDRVSQQVLERSHKRSSRNEANALRTSGSVETFSNLSTIAAAATGESAGKVIIRCQAPRAMDELLRDMASKVDYLFDRTPGRKTEEGESEENGEETKEEAEEERGNEIITKQCEPSRDTTRKFDEIMEAVRELKSSPSVQSVAVDLDRLLRNLSTQTARRAEVVASFCKEQRAYMESALDRRLNTHSLRALIASPSSSSQSTISTKMCSDSRDGNCPPSDANPRLKTSTPPITSTSSTVILYPGNVPSATLPVLGVSASIVNSTTTTSTRTTTPTSTTIPNTITTSTGITIPKVTATTSTSTTIPNTTTTSTRITIPKVTGTTSTSTTIPNTTATSTMTTATIKTVPPPVSCEDLAGPVSRSGIFKFAVDSWEGHGQRDFSERFCDMDTDGGGWTVIQRRGDFGEPRENFSRSWEEYRDGFGDLEGEFWFGNDFIHRLTYNRLIKLRIELEDFNSNTAWAEYDRFSVGSEDQHYELLLGEYSGNASDSMSSHHGSPFSTFDRNHDLAPPCCPCAQTYGGGWWFRSCFEANLNGVYHASPEENNYFRGIIWEHWLGDYSLQSASMKIRSADFRNTT